MYRSKNAFTFSEILIALSVGALAMTAVLTFFIMSLRSGAVSSVRIDNNMSMKRSLDELFTEVRSAQRYEVYSDFKSSSPLATGSSGDYLVLFYTAVDNAVVVPRRVVGYYIDRSNPAVPQLLKHELTSGGSTPSSSVRARPPSTATPPNLQEVARLITNTEAGRGLFSPVSASSVRFEASFFPSRYVNRTSRSFQQSNVEVTLAIRN